MRFRKLVKALYGLKQAAQAFSPRRKEVLEAVGFQRFDTNHAVSESCQGRDDRMAIAQAHVDEML